MYSDFFKDKRVIMMGLGLLGRGIGDAIYIAKYCKELVITDKKSAIELQSSVDKIKSESSELDFSKIKFIFGEHRLEDFKNVDFVIKSAGVPLHNIYIEEAKRNNVPVYMSAALMVYIIKKSINANSIKIIGVTGTRGKSTVTSAIYHTLSQINSTTKVHLAGNVRGVANFPLLDIIAAGDQIVLELDSWQLQGFGDLGISPDISVFTNFMDDHLNYYNNDRQLYFNDKANIFKFQNESNYLIASTQAAMQIEKYNPKFTSESNYTLINPDHINIKSNLVVVDYNSGILINNKSLIGSHNKTNLLLAYHACVSSGVDNYRVMEALESFKSVEGRLEYMGKVISSKHLYNDNNATNPDAVIAGLKAVHEEYNSKPILICGGTDKQLDLDDLVNAIINYSGSLILLTGTGTDKLKLALDGKIDYVEFDTLGECLDAAVKVPGEVILFSPGFASFSNYFNNEYERNDEFVKCAEALRN